MANQPPNRDVRQPKPGEDLERPPHLIEDPDERVDEAIDESFPASDPPSFTPSRTGPPSKKPDLPSTGLPSDAPGGQGWAKGAGPKHAGPGNAITDCATPNAVVRRPVAPSASGRRRPAAVTRDRRPSRGPRIDRNTPTLSCGRLSIRTSRPGAAAPPRGRTPGFPRRCCGRSRSVRIARWRNPVGRASRVRDPRRTPYR